MGLVYNIQHYSLHDGPGIRTTVFLKGCPLDCPWCHNPESKAPYPQTMHSSDACLGCGRCVEACPSGCLGIEGGKVNYDATNCIHCLACSKACTYGGVATVGEEMSAQQVLAEVMKDKPFYEESGGGITISGGEPMMQRGFTKALLLSAKRQCIHTCVETCGCMEQREMMNTLRHADLVLYDIKDTDKARLKEHTGGDLDRILFNLYALDVLGVTTQIRCIMIRGVNMEDAHYRRLADIYDQLIHCEALELLPYHSYGEAKMPRLGSKESPRADWIPTEDDMTKARERIRGYMKTKKSII